VYRTTTSIGHGFNGFLPLWTDVLRPVSGGMDEGAAPTDISSSANSSRFSLRISDFLARNFLAVGRQTFTELADRRIPVS
jgi:hypothetical protein